MAYPTSHPWSLKYVAFKAFAMLMRGIAVPAVWAGIHYINKHGVEGVTRRAEHVPSRDGRRTIKVHIYEREETQGDKKAVLINFHGSGFVINGLGADDIFCARTASKLNCIVIDSDYRKAPEAPFPAGLHDAEDVTLWVLSQPERFDVSRISLSGFSAGGNLAIAVSCALGPEKVRSTATFYPMVDRVPTPFQKQAPDAQPNPLLRYLFRYFDLSYTVDEEQATDPRISVTRASPNRFPRTMWIVCGGGDILYNESQLLVKKLKASGHQGVTFVGVPHQLHGFDKEGVDAPAMKKEYYAQAADAVAKSWE